MFSSALLLNLRDYAKKKNLIIKLFLFSVVTLSFLFVVENKKTFKQEYKVERFFPVTAANLFYELHE